jgi:hypothetical protein
MNAFRHWLFIKINITNSDINEMHKVVKQDKDHNYQPTIWNNQAVILLAAE